MHEFIVYLFFGSPKKIHEFKISENLLKKLISWEIETKDIEFENNFKIKSLIYNHENKTKKNERKLYKKKLLKIKPQMPLTLQRQLHNEIRKKIKLKVKSPFFKVNTRSWITNPLKDFEYGPTKMHRDGFWHGHLKVMIYLTPLNNEYGKLEIKNYGVITNRDIGHAILFLNSDLLHKAIPSNSKENLNRNYNYAWIIKS